MKKDDLNVWLVPAKKFQSMESQFDVVVEDLFNASIKLEEKEKVCKWEWGCLSKWIWLLMTWTVWSVLGLNRGRGQVLQLFYHAKSVFFLVNANLHCLNIVSCLFFYFFPLITSGGIIVHCWSGLACCLYCSTKSGWRCIGRFPLALAKNIWKFSSQWEARANTWRNVPNPADQLKARTHGPTHTSNLIKPTHTRINRGKYMHNAHWST